MLSHVILGLLRDGRRAHGYELAKAYRLRSGIQVASGSFYRELSHLVRDRLLTPASNLAGADPRRLPYEITDHGRWTFDTWLTALVPNEDLSHRLMFFDQLRPATRVNLLHQWEETFTKQVEELAAQRGEALQRLLPAAEPAERLFPTLLGRRLRMLRADVEFLREFRREVRRWDAPVRRCTTRAADFSLPARQERC